MIQGYLEKLKANIIYAVIGALVTGLAFGQMTGGSTKHQLQTAIVPVLSLRSRP